MTSNITKSFNQRKKFGLRMATGGIVEQMNSVANLSNTDRYKLGMSGTAAEASTLQERAGILSGLQQAVPTPAPAAAATVPSAAAVQPKPYDHMATIQSRGNEIESLGTKLRNMQNSAVRGGKEVGSSMAPLPKVGLRAGGVIAPEQGQMYEIDGPGDGSGVDDKVAVSVHGKDIKVSKNEKFAVFPASVPSENIEAFIESQTGQPSATAKRGGLRDGMKAQTGIGTDVIDPRELRPEFRSQAQTPVIEPAAKPGVENLRTVNAERAATKAAEAYRPAMNAGSANDALRAAGKLPGGPTAPVAVAEQPVAQGAARSLGTRALSGVTPVATGVGLGVLAAQLVDSIPSHRGKATASDSNAELAGTPQHQRVQDEERVAGDDAWEKRHGKSLGADHARVTNQTAQQPAKQTSFEVDPRDKIVRPTNKDITVSGVVGENLLTPAPGLRDATLKTLADGTDIYKGTSNKDATEMVAPNGGGYLTTAPDAKGVRKAIFMPGEQTPYIGVDGKATNNWYDTQAYKDAIARQETNKQTLRDLQYQNALSSIDSHNPAYQQEGLRTASALLARDNMEADKAAKAATLNLQSAQLRRELNKDAQTQANADRTYEAGREDKHEAQIKDILDTAAGDKKADGYAQRRRLLDKYKANFDAIYKGDRKNYQKAFQNQLAVDMGLEKDGRGWFVFGEKEWDGGIPTITKEAAPWWRLGKEQYRDSYGRVITAREAAKYGPDFADALEQRVAETLRANAAR